MRQMKAEDKFGRAINSNLYIQMVAIGDKLLELNWRESYTKPNLFLNQFDEVMVFADMRGTEEVPLWDDHSP